MYKELCRQAVLARRLSYSPYSRFAVGAALLCADGAVFTGCNIENAAFTPSICAERTAFSKAVSEGYRDFTAIAIAGGSRDLLMEEDDIREEPAGKEKSGGSAILPLCSPCGVCRQVMMEFCDPETFQVILARSEQDYSIYCLKELLPMGFGPGNL